MYTLTAPGRGHGISAAKLKQQLLIGYVAIALVAIGLFGFRYYVHASGTQSAIAQYREIQLTRSSGKTGQVDALFNHLRRNLQTISLLDEVRGISRHGETISGATLRTLSQIYLNLTADVDVSELYVVPADIDPTAVDPVTGKLSAPILNLDGLLGDGPTRARFVVAKIPGKFEPPPSDNDGDESEEYRLLREQSDWAARNVPRLMPGFEANVPLISGPEITTCDNSLYKVTHIEFDRRGFVFSVPFYGLDGNYKGLITAVIRTAALSRHIPENAALVNKAYGLMVRGDAITLAPSSFDYARKLQLDPDLLFSTIQDLAIPDPRGGWYLWYGEPNSLFEQSSEAGFNRKSLHAGMLLIVLIAAAAAVVWGMLHRTIRMKSENEQALRGMVAARTRELETLMDAAMKAESEAESRKRHALLEANAVLEQFVTYAPAAIAMFDLDLRYVAHTRVWNSQHRLEETSLVGLHQYEVMPELQEAWAPVLQRCLDGHIEQHAPQLFTRADGTEQWISWEMRPWKANDGTLRGVVIATEDNTARRAIEVELHKALKSAESAARSKADFLANMSHELRTPLTGIIGFADLLLNDQTEPLTSDQRQTVEIQRRSASDLMQIVNDILDFSKADSGNLQLEEIPVVISDLIAGCTATIQSTVRKKSIDLQVSVDAGVPKAIAGDPTRLRQVLLNLFSNALKFTPERGQVTLRVARTGNGRVRFAVTDTGIGIPDEILSKLFTRFSQADESTTRKYGGTGLGLAICRQMVELMRGTIDVVSRPGEGATFFFDIPAREVDALPLPEKAAEAVVPGETLSQRILIVEDNATNRLVVSKMLERQGCKVTMVVNGVEAVAAVTGEAAASYDLVLMDIQMPEMDGKEATRRIRAYEAAHPDVARTPIVALTANAFPEDVEEYMDLGMDGHVLKPVEWPILFQAIAKFSRSPAKAAAPVPIAPGVPVNQAAPVEAVAEVELPVFDPRALAEMRESLGPETAEEVVSLFGVELDDRMKQMAARQSGKEVAAEAHAIASAARSIGCVELATLCKALEVAVRGGETDVSDRLAAILAAAARAASALADRKAA